MANLAIIGSHSVNGVAAVHSKLVQTDLVPDFAQFSPQKFNNKTNGVTQRRWFAPIAATLARHGYAGTVAVEPFDYVPDGASAAAFAAGYWRGVREALG